MAILSLRPGAFRTRNPGRDAETDQARMETVRNAILMALADARRERDGLKQRMSMYYAQAATMLDTSEEYGMRAAADRSGRSHPLCRAHRGLFGRASGHYRALAGQRP